MPFASNEYLTQATGAASEHFVHDAIGSTVALTNGAGAVVTEYTYEPFGSADVTGAATANALKYTAREDDGTGVYYYRARYYHPTLQRFVGEDPVEFAGGDVNLYAYVGNRPTAATDPLGLWKPWAHRQVTAEVAQECGLSTQRNTRAAENGNVRMDRHPSTLSRSSPAHAMPDSPWRDYVAAKLRQAVAQDAAGDQDGAMKTLGQGLHAVQDAWAHDLRRPQGTMTEHVFGERNPDIPRDNPDEWQRTREATKKYLKDLMRGRGLKVKCQ